MADSENDFHSDDKILDELKSQNIKGFTPRGKLAIKELAEAGHGAMIFLIASLNSRIRELEEALSETVREDMHH